MNEQEFLEKHTATENAYHAGMISEATYRVSMLELELALIKTERNQLLNIIADATECFAGLTEDFLGCTDDETDPSRLHEWDGILHDRFAWVDAAVAVANNPRSGANE